jgi:FkbM family methyltransferase
MRAMLEFRHPARVLVRRRPHEPDFGVFRRVPAGSLLVDVGAHAGQSSAGFSVVRPGCPILAFEPHPALATSLGLLRRVLGPRFRFHGLGLADRAGSGVLHVPVAGRTPLYGEGTFDEASLDEPITRARIDGLARGRSLSIQRFRRPLSRLDDLAVEPAGIKLDAQGGEWDALRGMSATLAAHHPLLLIENNRNSPQIADWLAGFGYEVWNYDPAADRLRRMDNPFESLNAVFTTTGPDQGAPSSTSTSRISPSQSAVER